MAASSTANFHQNFWGEDNGGFEVLLQNTKAGITASKELGEFIKERIVAEDGYVKGLSKLHKSVNHIPTSTLGTFGPLWDVLKTMCEKLVTVHSQFVKMLTELSREIGEYHHSQKEKLKTNVRGEIEQTQESLSVYQSTETAVLRSKKQYQQCVDHLAKVQGKLERARAEAGTNPRAKEKMGGLESRMKQAHMLAETTKSDHQGAVSKHCNQLMEFQGKMSEACTKFESLEEEHLAQMVTFMIKIARTQDTVHVGVAELYSTLNSQLDVLTVEKLLKDFVAAKGTGTTKPTPHKFRALSVTTPSLETTLNVSAEDISADRRNSKTEKPAKRKRFKIRSKNTSSSSSNGPVQPQVPENAPEVDEEGYSIRPDDAANLSKFPDDPREKRDTSDSDSDFDDEPELKIKSIRIKDASTQPVASVDDIKASMMSLRLGAVSPGMRKATSSQSLNILGVSGHASPGGHPKMSGTSSSQDIVKEATAQSEQTSLIDLDSIFSTNTSQMPDPLVPSGHPPNIPFPLVPTSSSSVKTGGGSQIPSPLLPALTKPLPFQPKTLDPSVWSTPPSTSSPTTTESSSPSPALSRPRAGSLKTSTNSPQGAGSTNFPQGAGSTNFPQGAGGSENKDSISVALNSIPAPPPMISRRRSSNSRLNPSTTSATPTTGSGGSSSVSTVASSNSSMQLTAILQPLPAVGSQDHKSVAGGGSKSVGSSPIMARKTEEPVNVLSSSSSASLDEELPPVPAPRGASLLHSSPHNPSPTHGVGVTPLSPLATSQISAPPSLAGTGSPTPPAANKVMPLAIAMHETCNANFKAASLKECLVKVDGEVVMSFPASFLPLLGSYEPLAFRVSGMDRVERLLHNQYLLNKAENGVGFSFDMPSLIAHLKKMQDKASAPFYNVQVLKYEVKVSDGSQLPLQLISYMKCEPTLTNFRLDYTYRASVFQSPPTLSKVTVSVPIDGGVKNSLTRPMGKWSSESSHMVWAVGDVTPSPNPEPTALQAKFNLSNGPSSMSSAVATFVCEGDTLSGLTLSLDSPAYKISLLKKKCSSGVYKVDPKPTK